MKRIKTLLIVAVFTPGIALACTFDSDCKPGNNCVKSGGSTDGICTGEISSGDKNDQQTVESTIDPNRTIGKPCSFVTDCGPEAKCAKQKGSITGVCIRDGK
ncbi:MAG: hypothetical protein JJE30_17100 [Desulfuromonadales bacterium]|nr:hypothetical protein [Desulfuromonadales bacterium]